MTNDLQRPVHKEACTTWPLSLAENAWRLVPNYFGGYPWEATPKATLARESLD